MLPSFRPKTYQDIKRNLMWYSSVIIFIAGILFYHFFIPYQHLHLVAINNTLRVTLFLILLEFLGFVLVFLFEVHDKVYDRYFIKWRYYYDVDFIIPLLVCPFYNKLDKNFLHQARKDNRYNTMKIFYHFVADGKHKHTITENLIVRFYEAVAKYWITQINEIMLFFLSIIAVFYYFVYKHFLSPVNPVVNLLLVIIVLFIINRLFVRSTRGEVRNATLDEIEDIHKNYMQVLENEIKDAHNNFSMTYDKH